MPSPSDEFLDPSVAALAADVEHVVQALRVGSVREEEDFTSQMLSSIRSGLTRVHIHGLQWTSAVLKKQTEEPEIGADFAGILRLRFDDYNVDKAFLAQAKMAGPRRRIDTKKLLAQAEAMLSISPAAFVFLYRPSGIGVVPAVAVAAAGGEPRGLTEWDYTEFFAQHFRCFIGDRSLAPSGEQPIDPWLEEMPARRVLTMVGHRQGQTETAETW